MPLKLDFKKAPEATIGYLKDKKLKTTFNYDELQHISHHKAFTVAKITKLDLLDDIKSSLIQAMSQGKNFKKWKKEIKPTLQKKGWYGTQTISNPTTGETKEIYIGSRRLKNIFDTNTAVAYNQGRYNNIYQSTNEYLRYNSLLHGNRRDAHVKLHGIIKAKDDLFWEKNSPMNGWGCACYVTSHSKKELEKKDWSVDDKNYGIIAHKDWAYDTRFLSKDTLESQLYTKALNYAKQYNSKTVLQNTINYIHNNKESIKSYENFVDKVLSDNKHPQNIITAGAVNYEVFEFLKSKNIIPKTPHISLSKKSLLHMTREIKKEKGTALLLDEIKALPLALSNPEMILYDKSHNNILYIFKGKNKENKIAVEVNYKHRGEQFNMIITTGKIDSETLQGEIEGNVYEVIKR